MNTDDDIRNRLDALRRQYRGVASMLEMMEKGTPPNDLARIRAEKLEPIKVEIKKLEAALAKT